MEILIIALLLAFTAYSATGGLVVSRTCNGTQPWWAFLIWPLILLIYLADKSGYD